MRYSTKELSLATWPDFEDLFSRGNGWDFCACMLNPRGHHLPQSRFPDRGAMKAQNMAEMSELVAAGNAHGILVYAAGRPVGWCQFGTVDELPRWSKKLGRESNTAGDRAWRITCFVTDKAHRNTGVAREALRAVLLAIRKYGGGLVEAYPLVWEVDERVAPLLPEDRPPTASNWFRARERGGNVPGANGGALGMFLDEGFAPVAAIPPGAQERRFNAPPQVVVRRMV